MSTMFDAISPAFDTMPSFNRTLFEQKQGADEPRFADMLGSQTQSVQSGATNDVRRAAEDLVAISFIVPMLSQIRQQSQAAPPFAATSAEKQFGALLDQRTASNIVRSSNLSIVNQVEQQLRRRG